VNQRRNREDLIFLPDSRPKGKLPMSQEGKVHQIFENMTQSAKKDFEEKKHILSFAEFLNLFHKEPRTLGRHSAEYLKDMIDHAGSYEVDLGFGQKRKKWSIFERIRARNKPGIVGQEEAHEQIYRVLEQFVRQGRVDKLILLHGPNGSSKSSTAEALCSAMEEYSRTEQGVAYCFNWIFPNDKAGYEGLGGDLDPGKKIGFAGGNSSSMQSRSSFAHLNEDEILCKIVSEFRENPIFLLPKNERISFYQNAVSEASLVKNAEFNVPPHIAEGALSSKNKKIFDALLTAYQGDLEKVLRHVQVERFYFSARYRTGIATVEPQMTIDAQDRQLTMDRNLQNIPPVLQNIRLFEPSGDLVDANRGLIEFADLLKRPLEAFKYLLTTIEKMNINLASGMADLDLVMLASTNEKHLDAFKASPDWPSFKGRFELVRVPYLLNSKQEAQIYQEDVKTLSRWKPIAPHTVELLAKWAVLTRLRQPDPEAFDYSARNLIARLDPYEKLSLYDGQEPTQAYSDMERAQLKKLVGELRKESQSSVAYEGRFGASPREMKMLLYFAAQSPARDQISALSVFEEIEKLTRDRTIYDYLQFEPRGGYHDYREFFKHIRLTYAKAFHREFLQALNLFNEEQYTVAFQKYLRHLVAYIKKERVENDITGKMEEASESVMGEIEDLLDVQGDRKEYRERLMGRIASWRVETPTGELNIQSVFQTELSTISNRIYKSKEDYIRKVKESMLTFQSDDFEKLPTFERDAAEQVFERLSTKFGYTKKTTWESLVFLKAVAI
jgi:serine protein kinase